MNVEKLISKWQEKDEKGNTKVNIIGIEKKNDKYRVTFKEGKKQHTEIFNTRKEAEEFAFAFGGKNNLTVSAPRELLDISGWANEFLNRMGHEVVSISIGKGFAKTNVERTIPHILPDDCGKPPLQRIKKSDGQVVIKEKLISGTTLGEIKIDFRNQWQIDNLVAYVKRHFSDYKIPIKKAVTRSMDTNKLCGWERAKVGDGSKRMELRLVKLDGSGYQECRFHDILEAADNMAHGECERVFIKKTRDIHEEHCGRHLGL